MPPLSFRHVFAAAALVLAALAAPTEMPTESSVDGPGEANVMCCDGTESPTCAVKKRGCCSHHGGVCD